MMNETFYEQYDNDINCGNMSYEAYLEYRLSLTYNELNTKIIECSRSADIIQSQRKYISELKTCMKWLTLRYQQTLSNKVVKDADEVLCWAENLVKKYE